MINRYFLIVSFLIFYIHLSAQSASQTKEHYKIYGKVLEKSTTKDDTTGIGIPYATVRLLNTKGVVTNVAATDPKGGFTIFVKSSGTYLIKIDAMGYARDSLKVEVNETAQDIGTIHLAAGQQLAGVTLSAEKLIMKDEGDRLVYDVTKDPEAKRVKMMDIMKKIPNLSVNSKGKLTYLDEDIATIKINGEDNAMVNSSRQFTMRMIKGDVMNRIEVILPNTPENKSDKAIINIKLARDLPDGYAADLNLSGNSRNSHNGNADFITKTGNVYFFTTYGIGYNNSPKIENLTIKENLTANTDIALQENNSYSHNDGMSHNLSLGSTFKLSEKDCFRLTLNTQQSTNKSSQNSTSTDYSDISEILGVQSSQSTNKNSSKPRLNGSFSYGRDIMGGLLSFSYSLADKSDNGEYLTMKYDTPEEAYSYKRVAGQNNSTLDQSARISYFIDGNGSNSVEVNATYTNRKYHNSSVIDMWDNIDGETYSYDYNQEGLDYTQQIYSAYGYYNKMWKKCSLGVSLNAEKMINKGRFNKDDLLSSVLDYEDFIILPGFSFNYNFPKRLKIGFRYKSRTLRPGISYLNPYEDKSDPDNISMGNPNLKAEYAHIISLTSSKVFGNYTTLTFSTGVEFINNAIERTTTINSANTSITTYDNLGRENRYNMRVSLSLRILKKLKFNNALSINHKNFCNEPTGLRNNFTGLSYSANINYSLNRRSQIFGGINFTPLMEAAQTTKVGYYTGIQFSYSQTLIKDKLFLNISLEDPFSNHRFLKNTIGNDNFIMTTSRERLGRILGFRLEWNFGRLKDKPSAGKQVMPTDLVRPAMD
ncbi:MAG: outer membrane beta-barrel family protein [Rikenellaceae bacterium]|nr:outer membrane beta-barrel family protein [Rikenellaceae bacterium]